GGRVELGRVGAGTAATVATGEPPPAPGELPPRRPGGVVTAGARAGDLVVAALVVVNAAGVPGADDSLALDIATARAAAGSRRTPLGNTTVAAAATHASLDYARCPVV